MGRHEHDDGDRVHADDAHDDAEPAEGEGLPDTSAWFASSRKTTCPACGASGALMLGGGAFYPSCDEVTTNRGYRSEPGGDRAAGSGAGPG